MALCSLVLSVSLILPLGANGLSRVEQDVITDDFLSVSCPRQDSCLLLDKAGNIWFSNDGGQHLGLRSSTPNMGFSRIRMSGLLVGWAMDSNGSLWKTRDGGRTFSLLRGASHLERNEKVTALVMDDRKKIWLGTSNGAVYVIDGHDSFRKVLHENGGAVKSLSLGPDGSINVLTDSGWLYHWNNMQQKAPVHKRPLGKNTIGVMDTGAMLLIGACGSELGLSLDQAKTWKRKKVKGIATCLNPLLHASGTVVLGGLPGELVLIENKGEKTGKLEAGPKRVWRDAARCGDAYLLVGDGGARGRLETANKSNWKWTSLGKVFEGVNSLGEFSSKGMVVCFDDGKVLASLDSGRNWSIISKIPASPAKVTFVDRKTGFAISGVHEIVATSNGGKTWRSVGKWPDLSLRDIFFLDGKRGWVVGGAGALMRTVDGGKTWTLARMPSYDRVLYRVVFIDKNTGYAVGAKRGIFKSVDGGKSWKRLAKGRDNLRALFFSGRNKGWVGGDAGLVMKTTDGGKSWKHFPVPSSEPVRSLWFLDGQRGLAGVGLAGLWVTRDGGKSWTKLALHTKAGITHVFCAKKKSNCLIGGQRGLLLWGNPFESVLP